MTAQASAAPETAAPPAAGEQKKLWGGRFTGKTDPLMEKFNESLPFDKRMWAEDIRVGSCSAYPHQFGCQFKVPKPPSNHHVTQAEFSGTNNHAMQGSQAYAKALAKAGVLTEEEAATIVDGLSKYAAPLLCFLEHQLLPRIQQA